MPHALVARAAKLLRERRPVDGLVHFTREPNLDIAVSPGQLERALCLMDAVVKAIEQRGMSVAVVPMQHRPYAQPRSHQVDRQQAFETRAVLGSVAVDFALRERIEWRVEEPAFEPPDQVENQALSTGSGAYALTGQLALHVTDQGYQGGRANWREGQRKCLGKLLTEFVEGIEAIARERLQRHETLERERIEREVRERKVEEARTLEVALAERAKILEQHVRSWSLARDIRAYVAEGYDIVRAAGKEVKSGSELEAYLTWASEHANRIDPYRQLRSGVR